MKKRSTYKVTEEINIDERYEDGTALITIYDLSSEKEIENEDMEGNVTITYEYDAVESTVVYNLDYINSHKDVIYADAVKREESKIGEVSVSQRLEALEEAVLELAEG